MTNSSKMRIHLHERRPARRCACISASGMPVCRRLAPGLWRRCWIRISGRQRMAIRTGTISWNLPYNWSGASIRFTTDLPSGQGVHQVHLLTLTSTPPTAIGRGRAKQNPRVDDPLRPITIPARSHRMNRDGPPPPKKWGRSRPGIFTSPYIHRPRHIPRRSRRMPHSRRGITRHMQPPRGCRRVSSAPSQSLRQGRARTAYPPSGF